MDDLPNSPNYLPTKLSVSISHLRMLISIYGFHRMPLVYYESVFQCIFNMYSSSTYIL